MAYVNVPKDLNKVKNKILFNMTKRQLICLAVAFVVGVPFYFLTKGVLGTGNAATGMVMLMLPAFLFAMYEKDGMYLEQILKNMIRVKFLRPAVRVYETQNRYAMKEEEGGIYLAKKENQKGAGASTETKSTKKSKEKSSGRGTKSSQTERIGCEQKKRENISQKEEKDGRTKSCF